jgi:hypothetical protein
LNGVNVFGKECRVLAHSVARSLDLDDDGVMEQAVEQCGGDNRASEDVGPFGEPPVRGEDYCALLVPGVDQLEEEIAVVGWLDGLIGRRSSVLLSYVLSLIGIPTLCLLGHFPNVWLLAAFVICFGGMLGSRGSLISTIALTRSSVLPRPASSARSCPSFSSRSCVDNPMSESPSNFGRYSLWRPEHRHRPCRASRAAIFATAERRLASTRRRAEA